METEICTRQLDDFLLGEKLGKGSFGTVRIATTITEPPVNYALKYMKIDEIHSKESLTNSLISETILSKLNHPNILKIYGTKDNGQYIRQKAGKIQAKSVQVVYAVFQLARRGDLFDFVIGTGGLSEKFSRYFFLQILNAVEYLHSQGYVHRDLKLENILLDQDYNPLLADFGVSAKLSDLGPVTNKKTERQGTERCMSPELYAGGTHSPVKDDLYALGNLLFILTTRYIPFAAPTSANPNFAMLKDHNVIEYWTTIECLNPAKTYSHNFKHLISIMLAYEHSIRPSISEIRAHPWLQGELPTRDEVKLEFDNRQINAINYQIEEAKKRKVQKIACQKQPISKKPIHGMGPHAIKRNVELEEKISCSKAVKKILKEYKGIEQHKPLVFASQETVEKIENDLLAYFYSVKNIKPNPNEYKVFF